MSYAIALPVMIAGTAFVVFDTLLNHPEQKQTAQHKDAANNNNNNEGETMG